MPNWAAPTCCSTTPVSCCPPRRGGAVDQWRHQIDLNVTALTRVIGAFVPQLVAAAGERGVADLVNTSSIAARNIFPNFAVYSGTKAYVTHLSRHLRVELGPKNVRVSAIEPGIVGTELQSHVTDDGALQWLEGSKETMEWLTPGTSRGRSGSSPRCRPGQPPAGHDHAHGPAQLTVSGPGSGGGPAGAGPSGAAGPYGPGSGRQDAGAGGCGCRRGRGCTGSPPVRRARRTRGDHGRELRRLPSSTRMVRSPAAARRCRTAP
ncbi:SDR family NAD(P)-dependent oxidoreductase [Streptomyces sp. M19]